MGDRCDWCKEHTYNLEEKNPLGCTECYCFDTTDDCQSSIMTTAHVKAGEKFPTKQNITLDICNERRSVEG